MEAQLFVPSHCKNQSHWSQSAFNLKMAGLCGSLGTSCNAFYISVSMPIHITQYVFSHGYKASMKMKLY